MNCQDSVVTSSSVIRNPKSFLSKDRRQLLQKNREELKKRIHLKENILLDKLIEDSVITQEDHEIIKVAQKEDQVDKLLQILEAKTNEDYELFCNALIYIGKPEIVENLLLTSGDFHAAREKLVAFLRQHYRDIHLYTSSREPCPIPLSKLYVSTQWKGGVEQLEAFLEEVEDVNESRFVVSGEAGSGKTTTIKRICQIWMKSKENKGLLSGFNVVLPIVLRAIGDQAKNLREIIEYQYPTLSEFDVLVIMNFIENKPQNVLLLLDGFDELRYRRTIASVLQGDTHRKATVIVTTRPHGVTLLKYLGSQAANRIVQILGFNYEQIKEYIRLFFEMRNEKEKGEQLITYLFSKPSLLKLATVPIRLEMICLVWDYSESLGDQLVDLYIRFVQHLLDHHEKKSPSKQTEEDDILEAYKPLLLRIGSLANTFDKSGKLKPILTYQELQEKLGEKLETVLDFGFIVKYNPVHNLQKSEWQFSHLTIQEFFVAYFLANNQNGQSAISEFTYNSSTMKKLHKNKNIISFLCGLNPDLANKIVQSIVPNIDDGNCTELFYLLRYFVTCFRNRDEMCFSLPRIVQDSTVSEKSEIKTPEAIKVDIKEMKEINKCLFNSDKRDGIQSMKTLIIENFNSNEFPYTENLYYVQSLTINRISQETNSETFVANVSQKLQSATEININSWNNDALNRIFNENLPKDNINKLTLENDGQDIGSPEEYKNNKIPGLAQMFDIPSVRMALEGNPHFFPRLMIQGEIPALDEFIKLDTLEIKIPSVSLGAELLYDICEKVNKIKPMRIFILHTDKLPIHIFRMRYSVAIQLHVHSHIMTDLSYSPLLEDESMKAIHFASFLKESRTLFETFNLTILSFTNNNLAKAGQALAWLVMLPHLHKLKFDTCHICLQTMKDIATVVEEIGCKSNSLHELVLKENPLSNSGTYLHKLLQHMPNLQFLCIKERYCKMGESLTEEDLREVKTENTGCQPAYILRYITSHEVRFTSSRQPVETPTKQISVVKMSTKINTLALNPALGNGDSWVDIEECLNHHSVAHHLQVLSADNFDFSEGRLRILADHLPPTLQALSVAFCSVEDIHDLVYLIQKKPEKLRHLNFRGNFYLSNDGLEILELVKVKNELKGMRQLTLANYAKDAIIALKQDLKPEVTDLILYRGHHEFHERFWQCVKEDCKIDVPYEFILEMKDY